MALLALLVSAGATRAQDPAAIDLSGKWDDAGREAYVCNWGESWGSHIGIQKVDMTLGVSANGDSLSGTYESWQGTAEMVLTRVGCPLEDGGELGSEDVVAAIVEGFRSRGVGLGAEHVAAGRSDGSALWTFGVRLDDQNRPLPSGDTIVSAGEAGLIAEGRQAGAEWMLIGSIQLWEDGGQTRVTARRVRVETAEIGERGRGDAEGTDPCAIAKAFGLALDAMGVAFGEPQGLVE